jgi:hypothetical protein
MARKKAETTEQPEDTGEKARPSEVRKVISGKKLKELLNAHQQMTSDTSDQRGDFGSALKEQFKKTPFSNRIFRILAGLWKLTPQQLAIELEDLEHGLEASGLNARAETAPTLGLTQEDNEDNEDNEPVGKFSDNKVKPFPAPTSVAAE